MKKNLILALSILFCTSLACNLANIASNVSGTKEPDNVLYKDDFSDSSSGWLQLTDADGITDYDSGSYRIRVDTIGQGQNGMDIWSHPGVNLEGDIRIEVDATKIGGPDENDMGVLCRYNKENDA